MKDDKDIPKQIETDKDMIIFQVIGYIFFIIVGLGNFQNNLKGFLKDTSFITFSVVSLIIIILRIIRIKHLSKK
jgi:hypothetical protein